MPAFFVSSRNIYDKWNSLRIQLAIKHMRFVKWAKLTVECHDWVTLRAAVFIPSQWLSINGIISLSLEKNFFGLPSLILVCVKLPIAVTQSCWIPETTNPHLGLECLSHSTKFKNDDKSELTRLYSDPADSSKRETQPAKFKF